METQKVNIKDLANFIVRFCYTNQMAISNLKLQKILYYVQAWHLVYFNKHPLFDDVPEAWINGPVYREIYNIYKNNGAEEISLHGDDNLSKEDSYNQALNSLNISKEQHEYLGASLVYFGNLPAQKLVLRTHLEKPWNEAREGLGELEYSDRVITHDMMYNYYSQVKAKRQL